MYILLNHDNGDSGILLSSSVMVTLMKGGTKETLESAVLRETRNFSDFSTRRSSMMEMLKHCDETVESKVKLKVTGMKSLLAAVNQAERR